MNPGGSTSRINQPRPTDPGVLQQALRQPAEMSMAYASPFSSFAPAAANMFGSYADMMKGGVGTLGQMFDSYSKAYQGYGNAIGNIAGNAGMNAANENANRYGAWAQGNTGFQNMLGSLGASALGAYGSAANAAMQAQAMRESAAMKMMSDALAANQAATATYGGQQAAAQAALAKAYADAGAGLGVGRGNIAAAAANLGGAGSTSLANLGGAVAAAAANAATGNAQGQAALRGSIANSLSGISAAELNALAQNAASANTALAGLGTAANNAQGALGAASAGLGTGLGNNAASVAGNSMNYTRDMAKLDLARLLGVGQLNVAGQFNAGLGIPGGGSLSISGPQGPIAGGTYGGMFGGAASGMSSGQAPIYMEPTPGWYSTPQYYDGGGMAELGALRGAGFNALSNLAADARGTFGAGVGGVSGNESNARQAIGAAGSAGRAAMQSQGDAGAADLRSGMERAMGQIQDQGSGGRLGILAALQAGNSEIGAQGRGIDGDSDRTFGGLDSTRRDIGSSSILDSLNRNYTSSLGDMRSMYEAGRKDPAELLREVYQGASSLANPFLQAGKDAYGNWMGNFPPPLSTQPGQFLDPMPYLAALQAGWAPYMSGMDRAFNQQNANVLGVLTSGQGTYRDSVGNLNSQFGGVMNMLGGNSGGPGGANDVYIQKIRDGERYWDPVSVGGIDFIGPGSRWIQQNPHLTGPVNTQTGSRTQFRPT